MSNITKNGIIFNVPHRKYIKTKVHIYDLKIDTVDLTGDSFLCYNYDIIGNPPKKSNLKDFSQVLDDLVRCSLKQCLENIENNLELDNG